MKRRLRELVRLSVLPGGPPIDFVIHARAEAYNASFAELRDELVQVIERLTDALGEAR